MPTHPPRLSVVIPTLGDRPALREAVAAAHPGEDVEVVVVVDGPELLVDVAGPGVVILAHGERRGVSAARNTGLAAARGTHVILCDDDDVLGEERIRSDLAAIEGVPDLVRLWQFCDEGRHRDMVAEGVLDRADDGTGRARGLLAGQIPHVGCVTLPRHRVLPFDASLRTIEDVEFWLRNQPLLAGDVDVVAAVGYDRRDRGGPRITEQRAQRLEDRLRLISDFGGSMTRAEVAYQWRRAGGMAAALGAPVTAWSYFARAIVRGDIRSLAHAALVPVTDRAVATTGDLWDDGP